MRRFTHTFPQRISAFLLCLALLVGLLPAPALAVAPPVNQVLYVGGVQISSTGYWTIDSDGNVTAYTSGDTPTDNYIHYDVANNTLTLHNATIKEEVPYNTSTYVAGAAIGVHNQNGDAKLTITLEGTNTIAAVGKGIYVLANSTGGATLTITGDGSLDASASQTGIWVQSNSGNATLTIRNAKVEATGTSTAGYGVNVQSSQSSTAALTVDGGSLTASGSPGILYDSIGSGTVPNTTALTIRNSAIVDAREGGIGAGYIGNLSGVSPTDDSVGIVFGLDLSDSKAGTVYGSATLQENLTIGEGESLTIGQDASLTVSNGTTLTNNGTVTTEEGGTLTNNGKIDNSGTLSGTITGNQPPKITTTSLSEGTVNTAYNQTLAADNNPTSWSVTIGTLPAGLTLDTNTGTISGIPTAEGSSAFTVTAVNSAGSDSKELTLTINPAPVLVTGVTLNKSELALYTGGSATLTATVEPENATNQAVTWTSSNPSVATVENGVVTAVSAGAATITAAAADGSGVSATCAVTVEKPYTPPPYIPPTYAVTVPETTGGTVEVNPSRASSGRRVTITTQPAPGYELESLTVLDSRGNEIALTDKGGGKYTFTMPAGRVTVEASFTPAPLPFEDVAPGAWYESAVRYAYFHNIMEGMSATTFQPNGTLSRAMAVQIFYNLEGQPDVSDENLGYPYEDVDAQAWYGDAVYWARITGVATGYGDGTFQPTDSITRQEFAQMLYNYAKYKGYDLSAEGDLTAFPDGNEVQEWAVPAMSWANGNQLINGHDDGTLEPGGTATRAQAAAVLMRFDQDLAE